MHCPSSQASELRQQQLRLARLGMLPPPHRTILKSAMMIGANSRQRATRTMTPRISITPSFVVCVREKSTLTESGPSRLRLGSGTVVFREDRFSFRVPPIPGDEWEHAEAMTLLTVGDIGQTENSERTLEALRHRFEDPKAGTVAGLIIGDMSYADGGADRWDSWGRLVEPLFSSLPLHVLPGNHEVEVSNHLSRHSRHIGIDFRCQALFLKRSLMRMRRTSTIRHGGTTI